MTMKYEVTTEMKSGEKETETFDDEQMKRIVLPVLLFSEENTRVKQMTIKPLN